jgi:hypothetical protein
VPDPDVPVDDGVDGAAGAGEEAAGAGSDDEDGEEDGEDAESLDPSLEDDRLSVL